VVASRTKPFRQVGGLIVGVVFPLPRLAERREAADLRVDDGPGAGLVEVAPDNAGPPVRGGDAPRHPLARLDALAWFGERVLAQLFVEEGEDDAGIHPGQLTRSVARPATG